MKVRVHKLRTARTGWVRMASLVGLVSLGVVSVASTGCDDREGDRSDARAHADPDATLRTHEITPSTPTAEGLAYIESMAAVHREADRLGDASQRADQLDALRRGLSVPAPDALPEAEILRLQLVTRIARVHLEQGSTDGRNKAATVSEADSAAAARDLLVPMLETSRSLPLDRVSAEALITLGDAAARTGDDALAAGSYARSIRMMSILRQELER